MQVTSTSSCQPYGPFALPNTVIKASPGGVIFGQDMLFDILFVADWKKIGECRQKLTDLNTPMKTKAELIVITKSARKLKVYSSKQSLDGRKTPGQLQQSIQMEQSRFNVETKKKD